MYAGHLPDDGVLRDGQIDVLESLPADIPIILPSTTLAETRHRSLPLYNRLQSLLADEDRKVWIFWNEERRETATKVERYRIGGEDPASRIADEEEVEEGMDVIETEDKDGKIVRETVNDRNDRGKQRYVMDRSIVSRN